MPCQGPSEAEVRRSKDQGKLYQLVLDLNYRMGIASKFTTEFISVCEQRLYDTTQAYNTSNFFDECTAALCSAVKNFTEKEKDDYLYNGRDPLCVRLSYWWNEHKEVDRKREEGERRAKVEEQAKSIAQNDYDKAYQETMRRNGY